MNEEKLFENKTTLNKSILLDGAKLWIKSFKFIKILICILIFITASFALLSLLVKDYFYCFVYLLVPLVFLFLYPKIITLTIIKKQKYTFGVERIYSIYNDRLEISIEKSKIVIPFCRIKLASENQEAFYMIYENQIICISKSGFTIGSPSEFGKFIRTKINIK